MASSAISSGVPSREVRNRIPAAESKSVTDPLLQDGDDIDSLKKQNASKLTSDLDSKSKTTNQSSSKFALQDGSLISDWRTLESFIAPLIFTGLSLFTRLYQIGKSNSVTWDEAHFGKFGSYYLKHEYYFDVHPPLGKMLVGLSGYLAGYNGSFSFESGKQYPEDLDYTTMRVFNAMFNVVCVPVAYFTAKRFKLSIPAVWFITLAVLCETSYITLGKLILLDSMLACFTFTSILGLASFHYYQHRPFSKPWFFWLFFTGVSLGCVTGVKMVGLFATALVGVYTIADLWIRFGDTKMPIKTYLAHWVSRIAALIVVPILIFALFFKIHFLILTKSGPGDSNMSSLFQANLEGTDMVSGPIDLAFGSRITLKNQGLSGGLLHSHVQTYPDGSGQQQVTTYHHKDSNNEWLIEHGRPDPYYSIEEAIQYVQNGDKIRLLHPSTGRNLHSHAVVAPVSKPKWEVSCYGNLTIGDEKDNWIVEIVENPGIDNKSRVHPLSSAVRLKNQIMNCYLAAESTRLPAWGFRQGEVTCDKKASRRDKRTWWNIEKHVNDRLPNAENRTLPRTSFLRDFVQLNFAMMASNNALVPDPDKKDELASKAWEWPTLHVGLRLCGWGPTNVKYFLLGHPINTWASTAGILIFGLVTLVYLARWQRGYKDFSTDQLEKFAIAGIIPALGWFFHYLPFLVMARVTYVHHYLPALYFALLLLGFLVDHLTTVYISNKYIKAAVYLILYAETIAIFVLFSPISFGMEGDHAQFKYLNWLSTWRI